MSSGLEHQGCHGKTDLAIATKPQTATGALQEPNMGGCQNYGPFLDPDNTTAPNI